LLIEHLNALAWPAAASAAERMALPGFMLVSDAQAPRATVGFAHVIEIDGCAHLEQLSVLPSHGRKGLGRALVEAAVTETASRGYEELTLRTYSHVPWNAPFYETCGFVLSEASSSFHRALVDTETNLELERYGERVQMTRRLSQ